MPRTALTKTAAPGAYAAAGIVLTEAAADVGNKNYFVASGNDLIVVHNTDVGAQTVTITSQPDHMGRVKDIAAESIAAGKIHVFGPFKTDGWATLVSNVLQVQLEASNAAVKFAVVAL